MSNPPQAPPAAPRCPYPLCTGRVNRVARPGDDEWVCSSGLPHRILREINGFLPLDLIDKNVYWPLDDETIATTCPECPNLCFLKPDSGRAGKPFPHDIAILDRDTGAERLCKGSIIDPGRMPERCPSPVCRAPLEASDAQPRCLYCGSSIVRCARCKAVNLSAANYCRGCGAELLAAEVASAERAPWASRVGRPVALQHELLDRAATSALGDVRGRWGMAHDDAVVFVLEADRPARSWVVSARRGWRSGERTWVGRATLLHPEGPFVGGALCGTVGVLVTSRGAYVQGIEEPDLHEPVPIDLDLLQGLAFRALDLGFRDEATLQLALLGADPGGGDREHLVCLLLDRWGEPLERWGVKRPLRQGPAWGPVWLPDGRLWVARMQGEQLVAETIRPFDEGEWRVDGAPGVPLGGRRPLGRPRLHEGAVVVAWNRKTIGGIFAWRPDGGWVDGETSARGGVDPDSAVEEACLGRYRFIYRAASEGSRGLSLAAWEVRGGRIERPDFMNDVERLECVQPRGTPWIGESFWAWMENPSGDGLDVRIVRTKGKELGASFKIGERIQGAPLGASAGSREAFFSLIRRGDRIDIAEVRWGHERFVRSLRAT